MLTPTFITALLISTTLALKIPHPSSFLPHSIFTRQENTSIPIDFDFEAEIAKLNIVRLSTLPADTLHTFNLTLLPATPGGAPTITTHTFNYTAQTDEVITPDTPTARNSIAAFAMPPGDDPVPGTRIVCETSTGSPIIRDVIFALAHLNEHADTHPGVLCCQNQLFGSMCTRMQQDRTASLSICGRFRYCLYCTDAVALMLSVVDRCQNQIPGFIGGYMDVDNGVVTLPIHR